jgi:bifunctional non-homologous end joining protein LigD
LLNPVDEPGALRLLRSPDHWMQEKFDGRRVLLRKAEDGALTGINRRGLSIGLPEPIMAAARRIPGGFIVDGEALGDRLVCFDCLLRLGVDAAALPYRQRLLLLASFIGSGPLRIIETARNTADKHALFKTLQARRAEGVVFKNIDAAHTPGRPASGGAQLKHKFVTTASCLVAQHNSQRSVGLTLADTTGRQVGVGNVTIPPNHAVPNVGAVVEVRYLYAYPGGSLCQPVYQGVRDDITADACTVGQLKHKAADDDDV